MSLRKEKLLLISRFIFFLLPASLLSYCQRAYSAVASEPTQLLPASLLSFKI